MTDMTTGLRGAAKQAGSVLKGRTGIYATLAKEHGEVASLLRKAIQEKSSKKRAALVDEIRIEVLSHSYAEEETLYEALDRFDETRPVAGHSRREHEEIEHALRAVFASAPDSPEQISALEDLERAIKHHVDEEEGELFDQAERILSKNEEKDLDKRFAELKRSKKLQLESDGFGFAGGPLEGSER